MQRMPDTNIYKILDLIGSFKDSEIENYRKKLTDKETKIYDACIKVLKTEAQGGSPRTYTILLNAIHSKISAKKVNDFTCVEFFCERQVNPEKMEKLIENVKKDSGESLELLDSLVEKLEGKSGKPVEDLAAQFADVKESEGFDDYMHRVFLTTNEGRHSAVLAELEGEPLHGDTLIEGHSAGNTLVAVSAFCGLNMAAVRGEKDEKKLDTIIILDRSKRVEAFWEAMKEIIVSSETRQEVVEKINQFVDSEDFKKDVPEHIDYQPMTDLFKEIKSQASWLSSTRKFKRIKEIFDNKRFIFKRIDLTDETSMQSLKEALKKNQRVVDTFYVSNISEYLKPDEFEAYKKGLMNIIEDQTLVVDTAPRKSKEQTLNQRVVKGLKKDSEKKLLPSPFTFFPSSGSPVQRSPVTLDFPTGSLEKSQEA